MKREKVFLFIIVLAVLISYFRVFTLDFVWDDIPQIIHNKTVKNFNIIDIFTKDGEYGIEVRESKTPYYRPVFQLSFAIDYLIFGPRPALFHISNLIIHILVTTLLFYLLCLYFNDKIYAFLGAFFVGIYPARAEAVLYVSARLHILGALFTILSLYLFKLYLNDNKKLFYKLSCLSFFLAVFSVEMSMFLPLFLLFEDGIEKISQKFKRLIPYFLIILFYLISRYMVLERFIWLEVPFTTRLNTAFSTYVKYMEIIFNPFNLKTFYENYDFFTKSMNVNSFFGLVLMSLTVYGAYLSYKKNKLVFKGILWFSMSFFFVSNIPYIMYPALISERYLYFPLIGLAFIIPQAVKATIKLDRKIIALMCVFFLIPSVYTIYKRAYDYSSNLNFWQMATKAAPKNIYALDQLAQVYLALGNPFKALAIYEKIMEINPADYDNYTKIGNFYLNFNNPDDAMKFYEKALSIYEYDEAYWGMARVYLLKGDNIKAKEYIEKAIRISPNKKKYRDLLRTIR